jgi:phage recombination protein Bet
MNEREDMVNELAVVKEQRPVQVLEFSSAQTKLLADTIAKGCDENELRLFLEIAKLKRLDPFSGQIRPVKRWDSEAQANKMVIQTGIDGYRSTASRTGELAGIEDAEFDCETGPNPKWAKVTVYRWSHGEKIPYKATARWGEYVQKKKDGNPNSMWLRMLYLMLAKCAEALALRKAFPDELAGVYTDEEMGQADNVIEGQAESPQPQLKSPVQMPTATADKSPALLNIEGIITARKVGKDDTIWLTLGEYIVALPKEKEFVGQYPFTVGHTVKFTAIKKIGKESDFLVAQSVVLYAAPKPAPEGDVIPPMPDGPAPKREPDAMDKAMAEGKLDVEGEPMGDLQETRKGIIGKGRQTRLWTLMSQNAKQTGLTREIVHQILDKMDPPVAHLEDLPADPFYKSWESLMLGKEDWRPLLED